MWHSRLHSSSPPTTQLPTLALVREGDGGRLLGQVLPATQGQSIDSKVGSERIHRLRYMAVRRGIPQDPEACKGPATAPHRPPDQLPHPTLAPPPALETLDLTSPKAVLGPPCSPAEARRLKLVVCSMALGRQQHIHQLHNTSHLCTVQTKPVLGAQHTRESAAARTARPRLGHNGTTPLAVSCTLTP